MLSLVRKQCKYYEELVRGRGSPCTSTPTAAAHERDRSGASDRQPTYVGSPGCHFCDHTSSVLASSYFLLSIFRNEVLLHRLRQAHPEGLPSVILHEKSAPEADQVKITAPGKLVESSGRVGSRQQNQYEDCRGKYFCSSSDAASLRPH